MCSQSILLLCLCFLVWSLDTLPAFLHACLSSSPPSLCLRTFLFRFKMNREKGNTCIFYHLQLSFIFCNYYKNISKLCFSFIIACLVRWTTVCYELLTFVPSEIENTMLSTLNVHKGSQIGSWKVPYINHTCVVFPC